MKMVVKKRNVFAISAPSGVGKSTICRKLVDRIPRLQYAISATTRSPRPGEVDRRDYFFLKEEEFKKWIKEGKFLEWAKVHDHYYGSPKSFVEDVLAKGDSILLVLDTQGAESLRKLYPFSVTFFIVPPSWNELEGRLRNRKQDNEESIVKRLTNARKEVSYISQYDYVIVNENLEVALIELELIILKERIKSGNNERR